MNITGVLQSAVVISHTLTAYEAYAFRTDKLRWSMCRSFFGIQLRENEGTCLEVVKLFNNPLSSS